MTVSSKEWALRRYLRREVWGEDIGRKPPKKARRSVPDRDEDYKAWIRTLPCDSCGAASNIEAAHTGSDGGMRQKASDSSCIPLCGDCHTMGPGAFHRVGIKEFERRRGIDCQVLVMKHREEYAESTRTKDVSGGRSPGSGEPQVSPPLADVG